MTEKEKAQQVAEWEPTEAVGWTDDQIWEVRLTIYSYYLRFTVSDRKRFGDLIGAFAALLLEQEEKEKA